MACRQVGRESSSSVVAGKIKPITRRLIGPSIRTKAAPITRYDRAVTTNGVHLDHRRQPIVCRHQLAVVPQQQYRMENICSMDSICKLSALCAIVMLLFDVEQKIAGHSKQGYTDLSPAKQGDPVSVSYCDLMSDPAKVDGGEPYPMKAPHIFTQSSSQAACPHSTDARAVAHNLSARTYALSAL